MSADNDHGKKLLNAIMRGKTVWSAPADLANDLGWEVEETTDRLAELDASGWIVVWERNRDVVVTLSALGAERLGVRMVEYGRNLTPRWLSINEPDPPSPRASGVFVNARAMELEFVLDSAPQPDEQAEMAEESLRLATRAAARRGGNVELPRPTRLLGQGLSPWPGPEVFQSPPCPACGGGVLTPVEYCLGCDRWGLDGVCSRNRVVPSAETAAALALIEQQNQRELRKARMRQRLERLAEERRAVSRRRA